MQDLLIYYDSDIHERNKVQFNSIQINFRRIPDSIEGIYRPLRLVRIASSVPVLRRHPDEQPPA
jgi:hypothetical protein